MDIHLKHVSYTYQADTPFEGPALFDVDLSIKSGSYTALIGHTGSGKSTILQLLNGLLKPTQGEVAIGDVTISATSKDASLKAIRKRVGLVFQFAENQVFEETVLKDVAFGPKNFGVSEAEAERIAREKLAVVGLDESLFERSPFELSGGQMRRVAIAGVLAMEPEVLVLDEPTVGLDPLGRKELMTIFKKLHESGLTIVLVTHLMDDVANFADWVYVLNNGRLVTSGYPSHIFQDIELLENLQLGVPKVTRFAKGLVDKGFDLPSLPTTLSDLVGRLTDG